MGTKCKFKNGWQIFSSTPQMISAGGNVLTDQQLVSSTTETTTLTETFYANTFDATSMSFRVFLAGEMSGAAGGTADCTFTLYYGAVSILPLVFTNIAAENDIPFKAEWTGHILTTGATAKIVCSAFGEITQTARLIFATDTPITGQAAALNLTNAGSLNVMFDWDASSADNDVIVSHGWVELYN